MPRVDYDPIAPTFDARYRAGPLPGVARAVRELARAVGARRACEAGCGTGHWLETLRPNPEQIVGLDLSAGMLRQASRRPGRPALVRGRGDRLPFRDAAFDLVLAVNALHHFDRAEWFVAEARRLLRPGGAAAVVGMDPHANADLWYLCDYFPRVRALDRGRFPSAAQVGGWMSAAGFERVERRKAERIVGQESGRSILDSYFVQKRSSSQLAPLSDTDYQAGMAHLRAALEAAEARGQTLTFPTDIAMTMVAGYAPGERR